jgi:hypothetical protein
MSFAGPYAAPRHLPAGTGQDLFAQRSGGIVMTFDSQRLHGSPSGARINIYARHATKAPVGVLQINHGLAEHAARYGRFAEFMAARGFHV